MSLYPLLLEISLVEQESVLNSIRNLIEEEGWELEESVTPEEMLTIVQEVLDSGELSPEGQVRMEGFAKALHKAVNRGARIAGKVARGVDKVRGGIARMKKSHAMRKAKFTAGVKKFKSSVKSSFQAGRSGARMAGPKKKLSAAQLRQRAKAAQSSGKRRKGKKVKRRMLPPRK